MDTTNTVFMWYLIQTGSPVCSNILLDLIKTILKEYIHMFYQRISYINNHVASMEATGWQLRKYIEMYSAFQNVGIKFVLFIFGVFWNNQIYLGLKSKDRTMQWLMWLPQCQRTFLWFIDTWITGVYRERTYIATTTRKPPRVYFIGPTNNVNNANNTFSKNIYLGHRT